MSGGAERSGRRDRCAPVLSLLGGFELRVAGEPVEIPFSAQRVLAFLGLHPGRLGRVFVAGHLWSDATEDRAAASLRTALWRMHRPAAGVVRSAPHSLRLDQAVQVDVDRASRAARAALEDGAAAALGELRDAGELLPDWYEDWVLIERERFRQLRLHALERLCRRLTAAGRPGEAIEAGLAAVAAEPLRESAHRALIEAHLAEDNTGEALRQYAVCRALLGRDLGVLPSPALDALVEPLRRRAPTRRLEACAVPHSNGRT